MNVFLRFLKSIWIKITNYIPFVKEYRDEKNKEETNEQLQTIEKKIDNSKENKKEEILIRQLLDKKILDKKKLVENIRGEYYLLIVFAFPKLPKLFDRKTQEKIEKYLERKRKRFNLSGKRGYTNFLIDELKFKKLGYSSSTIFFIKVKDLPLNKRNKKRLKKYLEEQLIKIQKEEWDLIIKILNESKADYVKSYKDKLLGKGFEEAYNISFYIDYITFKKENVFAQNENSLLLSQLLTFEDIVKNKKNLESIKENLEFFDISLLFTNAISTKTKGILEKNQEEIKNNLNIKNIFEEINKDDLKTQLKNVLGVDYEDKVTNAIYRKQKGFRDFLVKKGVII